MQKCRKSRTISRALPEANRPRSEHRLPDSTPGIRAGPRLSAVTLPNCRPRSMRTPFQVQRDGLVIIAVVEKVGLLGSADEQACRATRLQPPACIELAQMRNGPLNNRSGLRTPSAPGPSCGGPCHPSCGWQAAQKDYHCVARRPLFQTGPVKAPRYAAVSAPSPCL